MSLCCGTITSVDFRRALFATLMQNNSIDPAVAIALEMKLRIDHAVKETIFFIGENRVGGLPRELRIQLLSA